MSEQKIKITYHYHSGFSVEYGKLLLVFDYWRGENNELKNRGRITEEYLNRFDEIIVFISHEHVDHMDPVVYTWRENHKVTYLVSWDMPIGTRGKRMSPGDEFIYREDVVIRVYDSTDLGVSYLVALNGITIFHAGDLNFWHWREESSVKEIEEAEEDFRKAVEPITKEKIDVCFFPVDPRQRTMFEAGANYFILSVKPRLMIPMHFWNKNEVIEEFARHSRCRSTEILPMKAFGSSLQMFLEEDGSISIQEEQEEPAIRFDGYEGEDPFGDSDLPVSFDGEA